MNNKDLIRKYLEYGDDYEGEIDEDFSKNTLRKMRDRKDKLGGGKPKREKPEWKKLEDKDDE